MIGVRFPEENPGRALCSDLEPPIPRSRHKSFPSKLSILPNLLSSAPQHLGARTKTPTL